MKHLGKMMAEHLAKTHGAGEYAEFAEGFLEGGGFFDDFKQGFTSVINPVLSGVKTVGSLIPHPAAQAVSGTLGALG